MTLSTKNSRNNVLFYAGGGGICRMTMDDMGEQGSGCLISEDDVLCERPLISKTSTFRVY